jgi:REP element-mobilizing transposase RayT
MKLPLQKRRTWGGVRKGAGRKPNAARPGVSHLRRERLNGRSPVHVTLKLRPESAGLRTKTKLRSLKLAFRSGRDRFGFRLIHFSVQSDHLHLLVEATNARALSRGVQGLTIRIARALNRLAQRTGRVFADRFHSRSLDTPREVRNALRYVILNHVKHAKGATSVPLDPCASGLYLDGWARAAPPTPIDETSPVAEPKTWLLRIGWKRLGLLSPREGPVRPNQ